MLDQCLEKSEDRWTSETTVFFVIFHGRSTVDDRFNVGGGGGVPYSNKLPRIFL